MKVRSDLRNEILNNLRLKTGININEQGSVAVAIVDSLVDEIMLLYRELERIQTQAYLTTSTGNYTQLIADLLDRHPRPNESESEFKLRVAQSVYTGAKGNLLAIQDAIWSVPGVADFDIERYTRGTGSFTIFLYPQVNANQQLLIDRVKDAVSQVVSEGIRFEVRVPEEQRVDLSVTIMFTNNVSVVEKQNIRNNIRTRLVDYINNLPESSNLYINELIEIIMSTHNNILDLGITALKLDEKSVPVANIFSKKGKRFSAGTIDIV